MKQHHNNILNLRKIVNNFNIFYIANFEQYSDLDEQRKMKINVK